MQIHPILLDSRPSYLPSYDARVSLLMTPLGADTVGEYLLGSLRTITPARPAVLTTFFPTPKYEETLRGCSPHIEAVIGPGELGARLQSYEPSDAILIADPRCFPVQGLASAVRLLQDGADPRWVGHLVSLEQSSGGTRERVEFDQEGNIHRIQRYYDGVTWPFVSGVSASLFLVACHAIAENLSFSSLMELRGLLSAQGVPSRDFHLEGGAVDLGDERGVLALNDRAVREAMPARQGAADAPLLVGSGHEVHPDARMVGPVVLQPDVAVDEGAVIVGPAVVGRGARIGPRAILAQSLVLPGARVPEGRVLRHQVVCDGAPETRPDDRGTTPYVDPFLSLERTEEAPGPEARARWAYLNLKRVLGTTVSLLALVALSPLLLLLALLVKLDSKGPVLYGHTREGRDGKVFRCWKFRTMQVGAEARQRELAADNQMDGPQFKLDGDPRVTRMGRILRSTSLDELPQLVNVVRGEMSLVGPRPSPFRENQLCVPWREGRLSVRPGITGLWQVCRHARSEGDFHQWIQYDLLYVRHISFWVDVKIVLATVLTLGGKGHVPLTWIISARSLAQKQ